MKDRGSPRLLHALKAAGPQTAEALGRKLGMTAVGARQHLARLQEEGLVAAEDRSEGVGRPKRVWSLTEAGHARFPDNHAGLTLELIGAIRKAGGEAMLDQVIGLREQSALKVYRARLDGAKSLREAFLSARANIGAREKNEDIEEASDPQAFFGEAIEQHLAMLP